MCVGLKSQNLNNPISTESYFSRSKEKPFSPVEFLVHLEKIYIKTFYISLERLESQDLETNFYRPEYKFPKNH